MVPKLYHSINTFLKNKNVNLSSKTVFSLIISPSCDHYDSQTFTTCFENHFPSKKKGSLLMFNYLSQL